MKTFVKNPQSGFTLLEVIVVLVIAGIVAAMVFTYFGSAFTLSSVPISRLQQVSNLRLVMENITADYNRLNQINLAYKWRSNTYYQKGAMMLPSNSANNDASFIENTGLYFICDTAGTSSSSKPIWPTITTANLGDTFSEGTVVWKVKGYVYKTAMTYPSSSPIVIPEKVRGHYYKGNGATSGSIDPETKLPNKWPKASGGTVNDGSVTWTEVGTILDSSEGTDNLKYYLTNSPGRYDNNRNSYTVVASETKFIKFNGINEVDAGASDEKNILKVTIKNNNSTETLTQFFTIQ